MNKKGSYQRDFLNFILIVVTIIIIYLVYKAIITNL